MSFFPVRRLAIDLESPFPVRWAGGDAFRSALFNALSMSFPVGEQFFIDTLRDGVAVLPPAESERFAAELKAFIGQEATHRHLHARFNAVLEQQGQVNTVAVRAGRRMADARRRIGVRNQVAVTAATEHLTAVFAEWTLRHPEAFDGAEPRLRRLWEWHAAEESEHRATAFEVYRALGGNTAWRVRVFRIVTWLFVVDIARQTMRNLWEDGALFRLRTWRSAGRFLFGPDGFIRGNVSAWRAYRQADFHPSQHGGALGAQWLAAHSAEYRIVGQPGS